MNNMINVVKLRENAVIPTKGSRCAAGYDLYACVDEAVVIEPHKTAKIGTGLAMELPSSCFGAIYARSGLATKHGLRPANCTGICDNDYRGEYVVALHNDTDDVQIVEPGERIAQFILRRYDDVYFNEVDSLSETERGAGGFGSTGKQ